MSRISTITAIASPRSRCRPITRAASPSSIRPTASCTTPNWSRIPTVRSKRRCAPSVFSARSSPSVRAIGREARRVRLGTPPPLFAADAVHAMSEHERGILIDDLGIPAERVHFIPVGIDADLLEVAAAGRAHRPTNGALHRTDEVSQGMGRAAARDTGGRPRACRRRDSSSPAIRAGSRRISTRSSVNSASPSGSICAVASMRTEKVTLLRSSWVLTLPARYEGFGIPLVEAMMCGTPVVTTDVPACNEIVQDGANGLRVPPDDPAALAGALVRLLRDARLRDRLSAAGYEIAMRRYAAPVVARQFERLYASLADRRPLMRVLYFTGAYRPDSMVSHTHGELVAALRARGVAMEIATIGTRDQPEAIVRARRTSTAPSSGAFARHRARWPACGGHIARASGHSRRSLMSSAPCARFSRRSGSRATTSSTSAWRSHTRPRSVTPCAARRPRPPSSTITGGDILTDEGTGYGYGRLPTTRRAIQRTLRWATLVQANSPRSARVVAAHGVLPLHGSPCSRRNRRTRRLRRRRSRTSAPHSRAALESCWRRSTGPNAASASGEWCQSRGTTMPFARYPAVLQCTPRHES